MQAVSATPGGRIVERNLKIVVPQEPIKSGPGLFAPAALPGGAISLQARRDDRACLHRLLVEAGLLGCDGIEALDRKSTRLNSSHSQISYAVFCLKKKKKKPHTAIQ